MRIPPIPRRTRLWLLWLLVVFGAMNVFGPPLDAYRVAGEPADIGWKTLRARETPVERLWTTLRDDGDVERYFAYAEAALGRPYVADFVRPAGHAGLEGPPDPTRIATPARPLLPWRDFAVKYPPGMIAAALLPAIFTSNEDRYFRLFALEMEAALTLAVWLAVRTADRLRLGAGDGALAQATLLTVALGVIAVRRYDPAVALAIAAAVYFLTVRRPAWSGAALGVGIALKGAPLLLAPILALSFSGRGAAALRSARSRRDLLAFVAGLAATLALAALCYVAIAGPRALDAFAYHGARPVQIETIYSGVLILARAFDPAILSQAFAYGSLNAVSPAEPVLRTLSSGFMIAGVVASWIFAAARIRAAEDEAGRIVAVLEASLVCLIAFLTLGKVFSPQYCVWLIPIAAAAAPFLRADAGRLLPFAFLLVQAEYPFLYGLLYSTLVPGTGALIVLRTVWFWRYVAAAAAERSAASWTRGPLPRRTPRTSADAID